MLVQVNGVPRQLPRDSTVAYLVDDLALQGQRMAIEVNEEVIPRSRHPAFVLQEGDKIEVVSAVGGG